MRLEQVLHADARAPVLGIIYMVPGSLGRAEFDGFQVRRGSAPQLMDVFVAVPDDVAHSSEPMAALIDLARQAVAHAGARWADHQDHSSLADLERQLDRAAGALIGRGTPSLLEAPEEPQP